MQNENDNLEFVQGAYFEIIFSVKNNCTKYISILDEWCQAIHNSKACVGIATAGQHRGLSTNYSKNNSFHQSKLGLDVELQTKHFVLFNYCRDVMQFSILSAQLGLGSELVDWYRDATSVAYGRLLIDLSPRTDNRLHYCTNTGSIAWKSFIPERLKHLMSLDDEHTNFRHSLTTPMVLPQMQTAFPSVLSKRVYPLSRKMHFISAQRKPESTKRRHLTKFLKELGIRW